MMDKFCQSARENSNPLFAEHTGKINPDALGAVREWGPTINALPEPVRKYIHDLETNADPAGMVAENTLLHDQTKMLDHKINELKKSNEQLKASLRDILCAESVYDDWGRCKFCTNRRSEGHIDGCIYVLARGLSYGE